MTRTKRNAPPDTRLRVNRGGGWGINGASWVRAASRFTVVPALRYGSIGFRAYLAGKQPR